MRACSDCGATVTGHSKATRCRRCAARNRYVETHGRPPDRIIANCGVCDREFSDYASNRRKKKHGVHFCSPECRSAWVGVHNSVSRGGDGRVRSKADKDKIDYRKHSENRRHAARARYLRKRPEILSRLRDKSRELKTEVINFYGGRCACCGESHIEFLTIDHAHGDGAAHRLKVGKGKRVYADIKRQGFPNDGRYRVLCLNCNIALGFYGYCPHNPTAMRQVDKTPGKHTGRVGRQRTCK